MSKALELAKFGRETIPTGAVVGDSDTQTLSNKTFSTNPTISSGTANGVAYLNGSKALTTSSALTFDGTNFATTGNATLGGASKSTDTQLNFSADTGTQRIYIERGSRSLVFYDVTTAIENYRIAGITGAQTWTVGGTRSMDLTSTGLGIGTSSPAYKLDVNGDIKVANAIRYFVGATQYGVTFANAGAVGTEAYQNTYIFWGTGSGASATERMRLDASGNLGIGRTPGAARLDLEAASGQTKIILRNVGNTVDASTYIAAETGSSGDWANLSLAARHAVVFINNATERMRLDSSGNLGIGTTSPSTYSAYTKLSVLNGIAIATNTTNGGVLVGATTTGTELAYLSLGRTYNLGYTGEIALATNDAKSILFGTSNTERMRIDSAGNVGIGTSSPSTHVGANGQLVIYGGVGTTFTNNPQNITLVNNGTIAAGLGTGILFSANYNNSITTTYAIISGIRENATSGSAAGALVFGTRGAGGGVDTERLRITSTGSVGIGTTTPAAKLNISIINNDAATTGLLVNTTAATYPGTSNFIAGKFVNNHFGDCWGLWVEANQGSYGACTGIYAKGAIVGAVASGVHGYCEHSNPGGFGTAIGGQFVAHGNLAGGATNGTMIGVLAKCTSVATSVVGYASYALKLETNLGPVSSYGCAYVHNNSQVFILNSNGGISNYSGNNVNLSDQREKKNIVLAGDYLSKICAIPIKTFNYNNDAEGEQVTLGVIAQEVEAIAPEFVSESEWEYGSELNSDGAPISLKRIRKGIYETDMMFAIMKSVQELNAKHEALKLEFEDVSKEQQTLITQLTARIAALEGGN